MNRTLEPLVAVLVCAGVLAAVVVVAFRLSHVERDVADCSALGSPRTITLTADDAGLNIDATTTEQCTTLVVQNLGTKRFALAFGDHDKHYAYAGYEEQTVRPGNSLTLTLAETGTFRLHNHYDESQEVALTIN